MSSFWEKIDSVYVINLDRRPDRWKEFLADSPIPRQKLQRVSGVSGEELPGFGLAPWFTERTGERAKNWGGAAGCLLSHRKVLELACRRDDNLFVVLEDDAQFINSPDAERLLARWADDVRQQNGLTYLGFSKIPFSGRLRAVEGEARLWELPGVLTTHAYMLHRQVAERILREWPDETTVWEWLARYRAVDTWYREYLTPRTGIRVYGVLPCWAKQRISFSDLRQRMAGGPQPEKRQIPHARSLPLWTLACLLRPLVRLKYRLNSCRTWYRARRGGLPGLKRNELEGNN